MLFYYKCYLGIVSNIIISIYYLSYRGKGDHTVDDLHPKLLVCPQLHRTLEIREIACINSTTGWLEIYERMMFYFLGTVNVGPQIFILVLTFMCCCLDALYAFNAMMSMITEISPCDENWLNSAENFRGPCIPVTPFMKHPLSIGL